MQGVLAEQLPPSQLMERAPLYAVPDPYEETGTRSVGELEFEAEVQARFDRWLGSLGLHDAVERPEGEESPAEVNFLERLEAAKAGSKEAMEWLDINIGTAVFEALFKDDYVGTVFMDRDDSGRLVQFGQTNDDIHENAITQRHGRHEVLQQITLAEAMNRHRIETALDEGMLDDHYYVVFSLVPDGVPEKDLGPEGDGYFLDSLTMNIQATTETEGGRVKTETAFTAGVEEPEDPAQAENDTLEDRLARRFDFQAVKKVYESLGQKVPDSAAELLQNGLYVPKDMMPHGVPDVVRWVHLAKDSVLGREAERSIEDYAGLRLRSKRREASVGGIRQKVREDMLSVSGELRSPMQAVQALWDSVRVHATEDSLTNDNIDPKVFGQAAASDITKARKHLRNGDEQAALRLMQRALAESEISGCGGGSSANAVSSGGGESGNMESIAGSDQYGARAFRCSNNHLNIRPENTLIAQCQHTGCKAKVSCD